MITQYYQFYDVFNTFKNRCQHQDPEGFEVLFPEDDVIETLDICSNKCSPDDEIIAESDSDSEFEKEFLNIEQKMLSGNFNLTMT